MVNTSITKYSSLFLLFSGYPGMQYIAVVECVSSGILYIDEIISRGYRPLVVNVKECPQDLIEYRKILFKTFENKVDFINEKEDFDSFIEDLRKYDIVAAFAGSEYGVRLTDRIVKALGLRGNDDATTYMRCTKSGMYEALGKAGIRRIESRIVKSEKDIEDFWNDNRLNKCVMKFSESAGTVGLKICSSIDEAKAHYKAMADIPTIKNEADPEMLIQEYIGGTEYIVDTLSCDGRHMLTDVWVYNKVRAEDGTLAYDSIKLIKDLEPGHSEMIRYAYSVLDAVDLKWGICHTEIKIDEKGPVLIETNARPLGLAMTAAYLDEILGYHLTEMAIDTYLDPRSFNKLVHKMYSPRKYALIKLMIVPGDIKGSFIPTFVFSNMLRSSRELLYFGKEGVAEYHRTIDLDTTPVVIKMANSDYGDIMKDYEMLRLIESNYFHLFYILDDHIRGVEPKTDVDLIVKNLDPVRKFAVVTDDGIRIAQYGEFSDYDGWQMFDGAIFAECKESTVLDRYRSIFKTMKSIRSGGLFIIVPESYEAIRSGSVLMEFMMNIGGIQVKAPTYDSVGIIYGMKK